MAKPTNTKRIAQLEKQLASLKGGKSKATKTQSSSKGPKSFQEKLNELKTFSNQKRKGQSKILSVVPNGKVKKKTYTRKKDGKTVEYQFDGATIQREDGTTEERFYLNTPFYLKGMW